MPACGQAVGCGLSVTRRSSGVAPRACVRVYARVLVPPNLYISIYILMMFSPRETPPHIRTALHIVTLIHSSTHLDFARNAE